MTRPASSRGHRGTRQILVAVTAVTLSACGGSTGAASQEDPLVVASAADLLPAFTELGESFETATGEEVTFVFGSSGRLAQQLLEGAPMDVYAAADAVYVDRVLAAGIGDPATQTTYGFGRLTIWSPDEIWENLDALVVDADVTTIAIANPEHAPYGAAAREALTAEGLWESVEPRLVFGENIADTHRLAATGNTDAAIIALSLAIAADQPGAATAGSGSWVLIDEDLHAPLQQDLVVITDDSDRAERARRFVDHVQSEDGREVMRRFGLLLPGEMLPDGTLPPDDGA